MTNTNKGIEYMDCTITLEASDIIGDNQEYYWVAGPYVNAFAAMTPIKTLEDAKAMIEAMKANHDKVQAANEARERKAQEVRDSYGDKWPK
jgi:hypothetical protein